MPENLMNSSHKATNDKYRENYEAIFSVKKQKGGRDDRDNKDRRERPTP